MHYRWSFLREFDVEIIRKIVRALGILVNMMVRFDFRAFSGDHVFQKLDFGVHITNRVLQVLFFWVFIKSRMKRSEIGSLSLLCGDLSWLVDMRVLLLFHWLKTISLSSVLDLTYVFSNKWVKFLFLCYCFCNWFWILNVLFVTLCIYVSF